MTYLKSVFGAAAAAAAALVGAAPAAAQYPGYPYGYGGGGGVGQVLNQVFGGWGYNGYGPNTQMGVQQCAAAVEQRLNGGYAPYGGGYGGGGRVVSITHADRHSSGRVKVKGIATSGMGGYGGGGHDAYGNHVGYGGGANLKFNCTVEYNGVISHLDLNPTYGAYPY